MRVLLTMDHLGGLHGGTEQNLLFLSHGLPLSGIDVELAALSYIGADVRSSMDIPVHVPTTQKSMWPSGFVKKTRWLAQVIEQRQMDIIHAFCPVSEFAAVLATRLAARGVVIGSRRNIGYWHSFGTRWRARFVTRFVSHFIANCQAARQAAMAQEWIDGGKISVIVNPLNPARCNIRTDIEEVRETLGLRSEEKVVAIVATVRPVKDYETFLRAAKLVLQEFPETRFLVVGYEEGEYPKRMRKLVDELEIQDRVSFLGIVSNPFPILRASDVGVLCSTSEGFSNSLLEYAVAGLPAVATNVGGLPEVVSDGETGFLVPPGSPERLASRIKLLLVDEELRARMGAMAKTRALARNEPGLILQSYSSVYRQHSGSA